MLFSSKDPIVARLTVIVVENYQNKLIARMNQRKVYANISMSRVSNHFPWYYFHTLSRLECVTIKHGNTKKSLSTSVVLEDPAPCFQTLRVSVRGSTMATQKRV